MSILLHQLRRSRLLPFLVLGMALTILGAAIFVGTNRLRRTVRVQMISRDGDILYNVALAQQFAGGAPADFDARLRSPADQLALALNISQIKEGVLAVRLYDAAGQFVTAFPPNVSEAPMKSGAWEEMKGFRPSSRYTGAARLSDVFLTGEPDGADGGTVPLLEVNIPIHTRSQPRLLAAAQLVLDARNLEQEFAKLDRSLWRQSLLAFLAGSALLLAVLRWAYRRLEQSNALLRERTARLLRANHELTLAAKTGALGAVTAHLVHGLSNPLANLQEFVATCPARGPGDDAWLDAVAATRRMQKLVHDVVRVLGELDGTDRYEITLAELAGILSEKVQVSTQAFGVACEMKLFAEGTLDNRHANLILLILENLVHNALQVTPRGRRVQVSFAASGNDIVCEVADEGPGFPPHLLKTLFTPCRSTKGGSGLGLAISQQMAHQLGAKLELKRSGPDGCVFALVLPRVVLLAGEGAVVTGASAFPDPVVKTGPNLEACASGAN